MTYGLFTAENATARIQGGQNKFFFANHFTESNNFYRPMLCIV